MKRRSIIFQALLAAFLIVLVVASCTDHGAVVDIPMPVDADTLISFSTQVHPLLQNSCQAFGCHTTASPNHGLNMTTYATIRDSSQFRFVIPYDADHSPLYIAVSPRYADLGIAGRMPFGRTPLSESDQNLIRTWINQGAKDN